MVIAAAEDAERVGVKKKTFFHVHPLAVATPVPASTPAAMEFGSPSRRSWADEVEEADSLAPSSSPPLNANAEPFVPGSSLFVVQSGGETLLLRLRGLSWFCGPLAGQRR